MPDLSHNKYSKKMSASTQSRDEEITVEHLTELEEKCRLLKICAKKLEKYYESSHALCQNSDCGKYESDVKFWVCSRCSIAKYCSKTCQVTHWKKHSKACKMFKKALRSGSASCSNDDSNSNDKDVGHIHKKLKPALNSDSEGEDMELVD